MTSGSRPTTTAYACFCSALRWRYVLGLQPRPLCPRGQTRSAHLTDSAWDKYLVQNTVERRSVSGPPGNRTPVPRRQV
jgi:hypothetical protein